MQLFRKLTRDVRSYVQKVSYIVTLSWAKDLNFVCYYMFGSLIHVVLTVR